MTTLSTSVREGQVVHRVEKDLFENGPEASSPGPTLDGLGGDRIERVGREDELDFVHLEHSGVLTGQGVLRLGQDPDQGIHVEILHGRHHRQTPDELGDQAVLHQVLGHHLVEQVGWPPIGLATDLGAEADATTSPPGWR